jgi:hypothetical protein
MRYLEIDSTYRNRNDWPSVGKFEIPISQTGRKDRYNALDPVSLGTPSIEVWTSNNLDQIGGRIIKGKFSYLFNVTPNTMYLTVDLSTGQRLQCALNYYRNLSLYFFKNTSDMIPYYSLKIAGYEYIGKYTIDGKLSDIGAVYLLVLPTDFQVTDTFVIEDPTNFEDPYNPIIFVPFANVFIEPILNNFNNYILYNETKREYRTVKFFDTITSSLSIVTVGEETAISGPVNWSAKDSFSIRLKPPIVPTPLNSPLIIEDSYTFTPLNSTETVTIYTTESRLVLSGNTELTPENYYKNGAVRITNHIYNYIFTGELTIKPQLKYPINESIIITHDFSHEDKNTGKIYLIVTLQKKLKGKIHTGYESTMRAEILEFSYDNYNPFTYNGSLTSQQNLVCYEISLFDLVLPSVPLLNTGGGNIGNFPYVYVEISNISSSSSGNRNILYSNNPNSTFATFRCSVPSFDNSEALASFPFLSITPSNMQTQLIKFKPNDNLYFTVRMPNGEIFTPLIFDTVSPHQPLRFLQVSASFSLKRIG